MRHACIALLAACLCLPAAADARQAGVTHPRLASTMSEAELLAGAGAGLAHAADANGYPGPKHVLEMADALVLTDTQRLLTTRLRDETLAKARAAGKDLLEAERALEARFAAGRIDGPGLSAALDRIGALQAKLRGIHLRAHLRQRELLTTIQITRYRELRGAARSPAPAPDAAAHAHGGSGGSR